MKKTSMFLLFAIMAIGSLAACAPQSAPATEQVVEPPAFADGSGRIAFGAQMEAKDQYEIFVLDLSTNEVTRLTKNGFADISPSWSQQGDRIVYASNVNGIYDIFSMDALGNEQAQVLDLEGDDTEPDWMPSETESVIVFQSNTYGDYDIFTYNLDTEKSTQLTKSDAQETQANWSSDGRQIAYVSNADGDFDIYVMNADGTQPTQLTSNRAYDSTPVWSPDGQRIAFISKRDPDPHFHIYLMNADGSEEEQLTQSDYTDHSPAWSPDGQHLAFISETPQGSRIMVMNIISRDVYSLLSGYYDYARLSWTK